MEIKKQAKKLRDSLQQLIYKIINPLVHGMIKIGITLIWLQQSDSSGT